MVFKVTPTLPTYANENIVTSGLVLNLDAGKLASYPGSGTTWTDLSGLGNNGTLVNSPAYSSSNGGSLAFNGSNQYVAIGSQSIIGSGASPFTGEMFVFNTKTFNASGDYVMFFRVKQDSEFFITLLNVSGTPYLYSVFRSYPQWANPVTALDYIGRWFCIHAVYNGGGKNIASSYEIYINGSKLSTGTVNLGTAGGLSSNCNIIGADGTSGCNATSGYASGRISTYKLYNRALSAAEIAQNFNALRYRYGI